MAYIEQTGTHAPSLYRALASTRAGCPLDAPGILHQTLDVKEAREQAYWWTKIENDGPWILAENGLAFLICESKWNLKKALDLLKQRQEWVETRLAVEVFCYVSVYNPINETNQAGIFQTNNRILAEGDTQIKNALEFLERMSDEQFGYSGSEENTLENLQISRWIDGYLNQNFHPARIMHRDIGAIRITTQQYSNNQ